MSIFRTRSSDRDTETDRKRFQRLIGTLQAVFDEIAAERNGLEARQRKIKDDAGFSMLALEESGDEKMSGKVDQLTDSLMFATHRLSSLEDQISMISRILKDVAAFSDDAVSKRPKMPGAFD